MREFTESEDNFIIKNNGKKVKWIAEQLNRTTMQIYRRRERLGLTPKRGKVVEDELEIKVAELYNYGYNRNEIKDMLNENTVNRISQAISQATRSGLIPTDEIEPVDVNHYPKKDKFSDSKIYAVMIKERTLAEGNVKQIAEQLGISEHSVKYMTSPSRIKYTKRRQARRLVYLYDENEWEDDYEDD